MSTEDLNIIPKRLDAPPKILFWEVDTVVVFALPVWLIGFILKELVIGLLIGIALVKGFNYVKSSAHPKFLKHFIYWYMPSGLGGISLKSLPGSHVRNFLS